MKLHYIEKGTGPCRIWLHGFLGNSLNFANYANRIPGRHFLLDARNHGRSFHHELFDYNAMAQDVINLMDSMKISTTALCGYSMGAKTAMTVASRIPDRIHKLVILDSMPVNYEHLIPQYFNNLERYVISIQLEIMKNINLNRPSRQEILQEISDLVRSPAVLALMGTNLVPKKSVGFQWRVNVNYLQQGFKNLLVEPELQNKYLGKTLVIGGSKSEHTGKCKGISDSEDIRHTFLNFFPDTKVEMIEGSDHYLHFDSFDIVYKLILRFLRE